MPQYIFLWHENTKKDKKDEKIDDHKITYMTSVANHNPKCQWRPCISEAIMVMYLFVLSQEVPGSQVVLKVLMDHISGSLETWDSSNLQHAASAHQLSFLHNATQFCGHHLHQGIYREVQTQDKRVKYATKNATWCVFVYIQ